MAKPFKFRYVNELAGGFVVLIVAIVITIVVLMGQSQKWFTPTTRLSLILPEEGSLGLKKGSDVLVLGTVVGSVTSLGVAPDGRMRAAVRIQSEFTRFVRQDSVAVIRRTLGFGDAYVEITRGRGDLLPVQDAVLNAKAEGAPTAMVEDTIEQVRAEIVPAMKELRQAIDQYTKLAEGFRDPKGNLQQVLEHGNHLAADADRAQAMVKAGQSLDELQGILKDVRKTTSSLAGSIDDQVRQLTALVSETRQAVEKMQSVLADVQKGTQRLPVTAASLDQAVQALPGLIMQTQETMRQTQRLVEGVQKNWLVRPYVQQESGGDRLSPEQLGGQP